MIGCVGEMIWVGTRDDGTALSESSETSTPSDTLCSASAYVSGRISMVTRDSWDNRGSTIAVVGEVESPLPHIGFIGTSSSGCNDAGDPSRVEV